MTSAGHLLKGSGDFMGATYLLYVTTFSCLVAINFLAVEIEGFQFVTWPKYQKFYPEESDKGHDESETVKWNNYDFFPNHEKPKDYIDIANNGRACKSNIAKKCFL